MANGIIPISIPRIEKYSYSSNFNYGYKQHINEDEIEIPKIITLQNENYNLVSAVCYKTFENSGLFDLCLSREYIGRYALNKVDENNWVKYDPNTTILSPQLKNQFHNDIIKNFLITEKKIDKSFNDITLNDLKESITNDNYVKNKVDQLRQQKYSINDFKISETQAMCEISKYGTLLIYSTENDNRFINDCYSIS